MTTAFTRIACTLLVASSFTVASAPLPWGSEWIGTSAVLADDDDGGDDGGDDDGGDDGGGGGTGGGAPSGSGAADPGGGGSGGGGSGGGSGGGFVERLFGGDAPRRQTRPAAPRAAPAPPPPVAAENEILASGLGAEEVGLLLAEGFALLAETVAADGVRTIRLRVPAGTSEADALRRVQEIAPSAVVDRNHFYRPQQEGACTAQICRHWSPVGWLMAADRSCAGTVTIGVVDTGVNAGHEVFRGARLDVVTLRDETEPPSDTRHGTGVVAMLIGAPESRVPGLVPEARVVAADPFTRSGTDERTDAFGLVAALDTLSREGADVASLSLAGPDNRLLAERIAGMIGSGITVVAAVGNAGRAAEPLFPAAYPGVIGVTAVDGGGRIYRRAVQGDQVDFAAPGVEIPTAAAVRGIRPKTGTSFAVPFVTAAAAMVLAGRPEATPLEVERALAATARDLGEAGRDPVFGHGMVQADGACPDDVARRP